MNVILVFGAGAICGAICAVVLMFRDHATWKKNDEG